MQYDQNDNPNFEPYGEPSYEEDPGLHDKRYNTASSMVTASFVLGVLSILSCFMIYISVPVGAIAIILALLSRRREPKQGRARTAITMAAAGMAASVAITGFAFYRVYTDPVLRTQMESLVNYYSRMYLGESASDLLPGLFGNDAGSDNGDGEEAATEPQWSDDLLGDHDALVDYFLHPAGGTGSDGGEDSKDGTSSNSSGSRPVWEDPVVSFVGNTLTSGGDFT